MLRSLLALALVLSLTAIGTGPASAADTFVDRESRSWTWEAPRSWRVVRQSETTLWVQGRSEEHGSYADVERQSLDLECTAGDSWSVRVKRFFRQHRRSLRSRNWRILKASTIFHPKGTPPSYRRQRLKIRGADLGTDRGIEVVDYVFVGRQQGAPVCHKDVRYREIGPDHTRTGVRRIKRVLSSVEHK